MIGIFQLQTIIIGPALFVCMCVVCGYVAYDYVFIITHRSQEIKLEYTGIDSLNVSVICSWCVIDLVILASFKNIIYFYYFRWCKHSWLEWDESGIREKWVSSSFPSFLFFPSCFGGVRDKGRRHTQPPNYPSIQGCGMDTWYQPKDSMWHIPVASFFVVV